MGSFRIYPKHQRYLSRRRTLKMNIRQILIHASFTLTLCNGFLTNIKNLKEDLLSILTGRPVTQNPRPNIYENNSQNQEFQYIITVDGDYSKPTKFMTNNFVKPTTQKPDNFVGSNQGNFLGLGSNGVFLVNHKEDFPSTKRPIVFPDLDNNVDNNVEGVTLFRENILMTKFHEKKIREFQRK